MTPQAFIAWRKRLRLSQGAAAAKLGISQRQVVRYEKDHGDPEAAVIPRAIELACAAIALEIEQYAGGPLRAGIIEGDSDG